MSEINLEAKYQTEQTMHQAWRKRAEEAELTLSNCLTLLIILAGGRNSCCAYCEAIYGTQHSEQCLIAQTLKSASAVDFNSSIG
jgi:hypothetical protein